MVKAVCENEDAAADDVEDIDAVEAADAFDAV